MLNPTQNEAKPETVDVKEYLAVLLKRKWLVLVCFLLSMACMTAFLFTRQPVYRASAKLFISTLGGVPTSEVVAEGEGSFYSTAFEVMRSQTMLRRVQQRMHKIPAEMQENLVDLRISRVSGADMMLVTVDSPSRDFARDFANALCDEFLKFRDEERAKRQEFALLGLTREINRLSQELKAANDRIVAYVKQNNLPMMESDPQLGQAKYVQMISTLNQAAIDVANAQTRKNSLDAQPDPVAVLQILAAESKATQNATAQNSKANPDEQVLGVGSLVDIQVDKAANLNSRTTIGSDGSINFGPLGKVQVVGLTTVALATNLQLRLANEAQIVSPVRVTAATPVAAEPGLAPSLNNAAPGSSPRMIGSSILGALSDPRKLFDLENQRQELQARLAEMMKSYRPKHPALLQAQKALVDVQERMDIEISYLREKAAADLKVAKERYQRMQESLDPIKQDAMNANVRLMEIGALRADAERVRSLYNALLGQLLKIDVIDRASRNVSVLEYAIVEDDPIYPKKIKGLLMAAFAGLGLGLALAFFIEYIDDSIKLAEEVERDLQLPFLGMVPAAQWSTSDLGAHRLDRLKQQGGVAEAYRVVRAAVMFSTPREKLRSILLASAVPREGKTTTCVNLSIGFAKIDERTLIIDGDLRRGELHKYFGLKREHGLADVLRGELAPEQAVQHTDIPKLDLITCGVYPPNPAELLLSWRLKETLDWAHKNYDRIVIDCPPIMGIADSSILGAAVDGVLFVIWAGRTSRRYVRVAKLTAVSRGAKIFGFILNNLEPGRVGYYHYYPYYYSYYSQGYNYSHKGDDQGRGGDIKGIEVPTPEGGEEDIKDVY